MDKINHNKSYTYTSKNFQEFREEMHRSLDLKLDLFLQNSQLIEILNSDNKISWLKSEEVLFIFYELLITYKFIECNFTHFQSCFMGNEPSQGKITFLKPTNQLPYIMKVIEETGFIANCKYSHIRLSQHFLDRFGKPLDTKVLRSSLNKGVGKKEKLFIDKEIIGQLLKYKQ